MWFCLVNTRVCIKYTTISKIVFCKSNIYLFILLNQVLAVGSVAVGHGLSCPTACRTLVPQPGIEPRPLHWEADSETLAHQGSPQAVLLAKGILPSFAYTGSPFSLPFYILSPQVIPFNVVFVTKLK